MTIRIAIPDWISPSYFPLLAAVELGLVEQHGPAASIELVYPVSTAFEQLRDGELDYVGGAAHAPLAAFGGWTGWHLLAALSQKMYWFLVVRSDISARRGDLAAVRGLRVGAAPGPVDGLRAMLVANAIDPDRDLDIVPVPAAGPDASFGVAAAAALADGTLDGFWANGMGAEVAVRQGVGQVLVDARRDVRSDGASRYTFAALVTTTGRVEERPDEVAAVTAGVRQAQEILRVDPERARQAVASSFPDQELDLIAGLVARDAPYYDPAIGADAGEGLRRFAEASGLVAPGAPGFDHVVCDPLGRVR